MAARSKHLIAFTLSTALVSAGCIGDSEESLDFEVVEVQRGGPGFGDPVQVIQGGDDLSEFWPVGQVRELSAGTGSETELPPGTTGLIIVANDRLRWTNIRAVTDDGPDGIVIEISGHENSACDYELGSVLADSYLVAVAADVSGRDIRIEERILPGCGP